MLKTYEEFIARVDELGVLSFYGRFLEGFPMLQDETAWHQWHTGIPETDPWQWKDRAAEEKRLAFGCLLGGYKGFIAKKLYSLFYAACRPQEDMEERRWKGEVSQTKWELYRLFENGGVLSTADIRQKLGVNKKSGAGRVDTAMKELQREFIITVCGNRRKVSFDGLEYGWPANTYCLVENWAPAGWLDGAEDYGPEDARAELLDTGCAIGRNIDRAALSRVLFGRVKVM